VSSPKRKLMFVERTSVVAHIYPSVLEVVSGRGYAECLDGCFQGYWGEAMQDLGYELPRMPRMRTSPIRRSKKFVCRNGHLAHTSLLASLLECPGSMPGKEGRLACSPPATEKGDAQENTGLVMMMTLVCMSASPAFAGGALKCSSVSRNTHSFALPDNAQITLAVYAAQCPLKRGDSTERKRTGGLGARTQAGKCK
jgi:hypothetical protein